MQKTKNNSNNFKEEREGKGLYFLLLMLAICKDRFSGKNIYLNLN